MAADKSNGAGPAFTKGDWPGLPYDNIKLMFGDNMADKPEALKSILAVASAICTRDELPQSVRRVLEQVKCVMTDIQGVIQLEGEDDVACLKLLQTTFQVLELFHKLGISGAIAKHRDALQNAQSLKQLILEMENSQTALKDYVDPKSFYKRYIFSGSSSNTLTAAIVKLEKARRTFCRSFVSQVDYDAQVKRSPQVKRSKQVADNPQVKHEDPPVDLIVVDKDTADVVIDDPSVIDESPPEFISIAAPGPVRLYRAARSSGVHFAAAASGGCGGICMAWNEKGNMFCTSPSKFDIQSKPDVQVPEGIPSASSDKFLYLCGKHIVWLEKHMGSVLVIKPPRPAKNAKASKAEPVTPEKAGTALDAPPTVPRRGGADKGEGSR